MYCIALCTMQNTDWKNFNVHSINCTTLISRCVSWCSCLSWSKYPPTNTRHCVVRIGVRPQTPISAMYRRKLYEPNLLPPWEEAISISPEAILAEREIARKIFSFGCQSRLARVTDVNIMSPAISLWSLYDKNDLRLRLPGTCTTRCRSRE